MHLKDSQLVFDRLGAISGIASNNKDWHESWDHYFDTLSSRLCHAKLLPCNSTKSSCVTEAEAEKVFRLGLWEYSYLYRAAGAQTLHAATASFGVWIAELAANIRDRITDDSENPKMTYRHNIAHDGSLARLLSILQVDAMVWPGMGAEIVFELYSNDEIDKRDEVPKDAETAEDSGWFVRVLWGGVVLRSSHPSLGLMDMVPAKTLLDYFDNLVGSNAKRVPDLCSAEG